MSPAGLNVPIILCSAAVIFKQEGRIAGFPRHNKSLWLTASPKNLDYNPSKLLFRLIHINDSGSQAAQLTIVPTAVVFIRGDRRYLLQPWLHQAQAFEASELSLAAPLDQTLPATAMVEHPVLT